LSEKNPKYILDTSLFTQAKRSYYAFDIAPSFWEHIINLANKNVIASIDKVYWEIEKGKDDLFDWIKDSLGRDSFISTTTSPNMLLQYQKIIRWSNVNQQFTDNAKKEFAKFEEADAWLIAQAMENSSTIVSQEVFDQHIRRKIPIPNVCREFNLKHIDTFTFLRECGFSM